MDGTSPVSTVWRPLHCFLLSYFYKKPIFSVLKYHIIAILIHLVTYISFRFLFPSNYTGNEISLHGNNFINALKVIWTYSTAYFPLKIFYYNFFEDKAFFLNFDNLSSSTYFYILIGLFSSFQVINILNNLSVDLGNKS